MPSAEKSIVFQNMKRLFSVKMHFELMLHVFLDAYFRSYFTDPDATCVS